MMFYSDVDWKAALDANPDMIQPYSDECLTPAGYDLRVGNAYLLSSAPPMKKLKEGENFIIYPDDVALVKTLEKVNMPMNHTLSGLICSKVSLVSRGLSHISTTVDSDWRSELLIALHNYSPRPIELNYGQKFCTIVLIENKSASKIGSSHPPGRTDVLLEETSRLFNEKNERESKNIRQRKIFKFSSVSIIILISVISLVVTHRYFSDYFLLISSLLVIFLPVIMPIIMSLNSLDRVFSRIRSEK